MMAMMAAAASGLSPRVRGNPLGLMRARALPWSIPACAGEPAAACEAAAIPQVYPRVCGGTRLTSRTA